MNSIQTKPRERLSPVEEAKEQSQCLLRIGAGMALVTVSIALGIHEFRVVDRAEKHYDLTHQLRSGDVRLAEIAGTSFVVSGLGLYAGARWVIKGTRRFRQG